MEERGKENDCATYVPRKLAGKPRTLPQIRDNSESYYNEPDGQTIQQASGAGKGKEQVEEQESE